MESLTGKRREIAREVRDMLVNAYESCIEKIWLYGSVARGEDNTDSDIDIECLVNTGFLPTDFSDMPIGLLEKVKKIEKQMAERCHKVNIETELAKNFDSYLEKEKGYENPTYKQAICTNIYGDKIVLYDAEDVLAVA